MLSSCSLGNCRDVLRHQRRGLVASVEARFAEALQAHHRFEGATAAIRFGHATAEAYHLVEPEDPRSGFVTSLGFVLPEVFDRPPSLPYAIDLAVPLLAAAFEGEPAAAGG